MEMEMEMEKEKRNKDRISELDKPIIHHIFSFLSFRDTMKICLLSKQFQSTLLSLPVIRLELSLPFPLQAHQKSFLNALQNFCRRYSPNVTLQEFSFSVRLSRMLLDNDNVRHIDDVINFAISRSVKQLHLKFKYSRRAGAYMSNEYLSAYRLPLAVLSAQSLAVLNLNRLKIELKTLVLNLHNLENLGMVNCSGIKTLIVSCAKLKVMKIDSCNRLDSIEIHAPILESLRIASEGLLNDQVRLVKNCFSTCKSVKYLALANVEITDMDGGISVLVKLESLELFACILLNNLSLRNPNLQKIKLEQCRGLGKIEVSSPNLQSFKCQNQKSTQCAISIAASEFLKEIELSNIEISDPWVEINCTDNKFPSLENVKLSECNKLQEFAISHSNLKRIEIYNCPLLKAAEINARHLDSVTLSVEPNMAKHLKLYALQANVNLILNANDDQLKDLKELRDTFSFLGHCKKLKIITKSEKVLIFPEEAREKFVSPMYDLQRLMVELEQPIKQLRELVDNLLWFAPRPSFFSIVSKDSKEKYVTFRYYEELDSRDDLFCCHSKIVKCWRHDLKEVEMESFEPSEEMILQEFLCEKAMRLKEITMVP